MEKKTMCGLTADEIYHQSGIPALTRKHAVAISNSIYKKGISDFSQINGIPKTILESLKSDYQVGILSPVSSVISADKSIKFLFRTADGKEFETVYLPDIKRNTVCVSTQSGCRMGCPFCQTSKYGFKGNLSAGEIISQIISIPVETRITHIVFMGMGEPLDNLGNVLKACQILTAEWGSAISPRNVTLSTVGITPGIKKFLEESEYNLTLSLYSPFSKERQLIVPVEKVYPVHEIIDIMRNFPAGKKRRLSVAYIMIKDVNDTDQHLEELKSLLKGSKIRVNLLQYHPVPGDNNISSSPERMGFFKHVLVTSGISASIRKSRGVDIAAACGLLATGLKR